MNGFIKVKQKRYCFDNFLRLCKKIIQDSSAQKITVTYTRKRKTSKNLSLLFPNLCPKYLLHATFQ
jgi:hypothetical protein